MTNFYMTNNSQVRKHTRVIKSFKLKKLFFIFYFIWKRVLPILPIARADGKAQQSTASKKPQRAAKTKAKII